MKRIVFLIIASMLVLGLVLPGCGETTPTEEVIYTFEDGEIVIGIAGEVGHATGDMQMLGATMAAGAINGAGGVVIDGVAHNITLQVVDTKEVSDETGETGYTALAAAIDDLDLVMGGFRTESLEVYREVVMDAEKIFLCCGASTEALSHSVVDDYDTYKYWFKITPPNEYFLADSVLRIVDTAAIQMREALNMTPGANLNACIVAEDLKWSAIEQVPVYEAGLPALNITNLETYLVSSLDPASTQGAIADIAAKYDPHIIIPVYSGTMGVAYAGTLLSYIGNEALGPMSIGINVYSQLKAPWEGTLDTPPPGGPYCAYGITLDTWAEGLEQTSQTTPFLAAFMAYAGDYPLYTASTYDGALMLQACLEEVGYVEAGVGKAKADDIITWWETPANAIETTVGSACAYQPNELTPAGLTEAQVRAIYDIDSYGYTYVASDWPMSPFTSHDLAYGPGLVTALGAQWQWDADASQWKKVGIWPAVIPGVDLVDQYGDWNFEHSGTVDLIIPPWVIPHFGS